MKTRDSAILRNLLGQTTRAYEEQLSAVAAEKELAQVTLASIGDGVLATDSIGSIKYLNPVAEKMTGWSAEDTALAQVDAVFRLVDEATGLALPSPVLRCLDTGESVRLSESVLLERRDGRRHAIECTVAPIRDRRGRRVGAVLVFQDVTEKRLLSLQLAHQASHDGLTGLYNRAAFDSHLQRALEHARFSGAEHSLWYLDLDRFKLINDTCGHLAGDELLRQVAELLQSTLRPTDIAARLGGDEFGALLQDTRPEDSLATAEQFQRDLAGLRFRWQDRTFAVGSSIGLVPVTGAFASVAHLLSAADHACYVAKDKGRDRVQVYQADTAEFVRRDAELNWVLRIQETLDHDRFVLFSQEIRPLDQKAPPRLHFEILLRMVAEDGALHLPSQFIRAAERYGLMRSIDRWVIRKCFEVLAEQPPRMLDSLDACAVNLSGHTVGDEAFLDFFESEIARTGVPAEKICFEVTETAAIENLSQAGRLLRRLSDRGVRIALDDFGSGMASYAYLKDLPVRYLKIDGRFVQDITTDPLDRAMVESINQVGHVLGLETIAEAVTSNAAVESLRKLGVDYAQGNWISPPRPLSALCEIASAS